MTQNWAIRTATPQDIATLLPLERACAEAPHWSAAIWTQTLDPSGTGAGSRACFVAELAGAATHAGFVVVRCVGEIAELESVAVLELHRGHGAGRALCLHGLAWAKAAGASSMLLEVRASNAAAIGLYRSLGFTEQGRRATYYSAPVEDAVVMSFELG